ncbi:MAG TPA: nitronate monooxygenase [Geminicoccaceae bacterium]|nr:nitronate monooxygenase [Geminicoccaceae bacterium]
MAFRTALTDLFGIRHPIILAPMGGVSGGALAAAVSRAGGLGLIGPGYQDEAWIEREFALADGAPVGIGFITWHLARHPDRLRVALARKPVAVMLSFGDPAPFVPEIRAAGARLILQVQSLADARAAAALGADVVVAQGTEAGGHGARRATLPLVPAVVDAIAPTPVAAAGGIADGRGLAAALVLGAAGALVGTRFYASREALGHDAAKARLVEDGGDATLRTTVFDMVRGLDWPAAFTGRALGNRVSEEWHGREAELEGRLAAEQERYAAAAAAGDVARAVVWASEAVDLIHDLPPAADLVERMVREAGAALERGIALRDDAAR